MRKRTLDWLLAALWSAGLLVLGTRPAAELPDPGWLPGGSDKAAHALLYAGLGFLLARAVRSASPPAAVLLGVCAGLIWGGLDECLQALAPGRTPDLLDLLADVAGCAAGAWIASRGRRREYN